MAAMSMKFLKTGALIAGIPTVGIMYVGYQMRSNLSLAGRTEHSRVYAVHDIPVYNTSKDTYTTDTAELYPRNKYEEQIGKIRMAVESGLQVFKTNVIRILATEPLPVNQIPPEPYPRDQMEEVIGTCRKKVQDFLNNYSETYEMVQDTFNIGVAHSQATVDYLQHDNNEVVRVVTITLSGLGGFVLGFRGSIIRKVFYASIAGGSMASLCYPKKAVELSEQAYDGVFSLYNQLTGESSQDGSVKKVESLASEELKDVATNINNNAEAVSTNLTVSAVKGDPGQSNPEDRDMYSTRSS